MPFNIDLAGYTAADLIATFPGIPRSTAYDWLSGHRAPAPYLQPVVLEHLRKSMRKTKTSTAQKKIDGKLSKKTRLADPG